MKSNYILLTVLIISLFILAGCTDQPGMFSRFYGKAIHTYTPPSIPELSDFPEQFLVDDDVDYILSFEDAIVVDSSYDITILYDLLQTKMCEIVNGAGYDCNDMSDTVISTPTGSFFANFVTGNVVLDSEVDPVYRCWWTQHWSGGPHVINHYLSKNSNCDGNNADGLVGYLYKTQQPDTVVINQCIRNARYDSHTYFDHFTVAGNCPDGTSLDGLLGYAPAAETVDTKKIYRCWNAPDSVRDGRWDHMDSSSAGCEGYNNENIIFNFIKQVSAAPVTEEKATLYVCKRTKANGANDYYVHTSPSCPEGNMEFVLGNVFKDRHDDTVKLVYCYWPAGDDHLIAANECDPATEWRADLGYVYHNEQAGTVPLLRCKTELGSAPVLLNSQQDEHFQISADACPSESVLEGKWYMFPFCEETDNGREHLVQGTTTSNIAQESKTDYCDSNGKLHEYFCDNKRISSGINEEIVDCATCSAGICTAPAPTIRKTIYRCYWNQHWSGGPTVINHYLSEDPDCGGDTVDGVVGDLYIEQRPNTVPVAQCYRQTRHDSHTYVDHFIFSGTSCPEISYEYNLLGYAPETAVPESKEVYRCWNRPDSVGDGRFDHMVSSDVLCEGYDNEYVIFNFLKPEGAKSKEGEACNVVSDCESGLDCFNNVCVSAPWPNGHSCTLNSDCGSNYCDQSSGLCADSPLPKRNHVYRCWWSQHWSGGPHVINHYLSENANCEGNHVDGFIGDLYTDQQANTVPLYQCIRNTRHDHHTYVDHFVVSNGCPDGTNTHSLLGYAPLIEASNTVGVHSCHNRPDHISDGRFDHMVSIDFACEGYDNEGISFNFLEPVIAPNQEGESCLIAADCVQGLDCIGNVCTAPPWLNGHSCTDNSACVSGYCDADTFVCMDQQYETNPIYRCYWVQHWSGGPHVVNHYVSFESNCGGNSVDGLLGHLYKEQQPDTVPVAQCYRQERYDGHTYVDHFVFSGTSCPDETYQYSVLGYAPVDVVSGTKKLYACWNAPDHITEGRFDHMISTDASCEGYNNEGADYNFLIDAIALGGVPVPSGPYCGDGNIDVGEQCEFDYQCTVNQNCIGCVCVGNATGPPWPIGYACSDNSDCISGYCNPDTNLCDTTPPWANGHSCSDDSDCTSGYCNPSTNVCEDPPTVITSYRISIPDSIPPAGLSLNNFNNLNTVLIGTCNDNSWVENVLGTAECNALTTGRALILVQHNPYRLVVAGDSATGVMVALDVLNRGDVFNLHGPRVDIVYSANVITVSFPHCFDNVQNYDETGVDCGGSCGACPEPSYPPAAPGTPGATGGGGGGSSWYKQTVAEQEVTECMDDWICNAWSACSANGIQTRTCFLNDYPECHLILQKPAETQSCTPEYVPPAKPVASCFDGIQNQGEEGIDCGGPCAPCRVEKPAWLVPVIIILLATAIALGFLVYYVKFLKKPDVLSPLKKYVKDAKSKGFKEPRIRQSLRQQGWSKEDIDKAVK
ncbi:hypothetical protein JW851_00160 [Candidatus Woesearchaeota archaeon]|nr:hypothetical protein [Candidatus Woesearchaeota archaeon]